MKTSVIIIAHNEAAHIAQCITSLMAQTMPADEIVCIAHNCTDATESIARSFPIVVVPLHGPAGIIHARIAALSHVSGDVILCIDGDSYAARNWIERMTATLEERQAVLVGSWVRFRGTFFGWLSNITNYVFCVSKQHPERWVWGSSMAFYGRDRAVVQRIFEQSIALTAQLGLSRNPDDYWLALFLSRHGSIAITNKTWVGNHVKESTSAEAIERNGENMANGDRMEAYFLAHPELR